MNIIDFWKQEVAKRTNYRQFDKEEFVKNLTTNVPDWKEQIKNKSIWPDLHTQGNNIAETIYTEVIIEAVGLEFACFLVKTQWDERHLDARCALDYCCAHIGEHWDQLSLFVQNKVLKCELRIFLSVCETQIDIWKSLTNEQKANVIKNVSEEEKQYFSDLLMYNVWKNELSYKESPYIVFISDCFQHTANEIMYRQHDDRNIDFAEQYLQSWNIPRLTLEFGDRLEYHPSERINSLRRVLLLVDDKDSLNDIEAIISMLNHALMRCRF